MFDKRCISVYFAYRISTSFRHHAVWPLGRAIFLFLIKKVQILLGTMANIRIFAVLYPVGCALRMEADIVVKKAL